MINGKISDSKEWRSLKKHFEYINTWSLRDLFFENPKRGKEFSIYTDGIYFDYSKNLINRKTLELLVSLAVKAGLRREIDRFFSGERINVTENRPALHFLSRDIFDNIFSSKNGEASKISLSMYKKMKDISEKIISGEWKGQTGKRIRNIVNIGIGGSFSGPLMTVNALKKYSGNDINIFFISNIDRAFFELLTDKLNPEETLFIIVSKSFSTKETIGNAMLASDWIKKHINGKDLLKNHFIAVTSKRERAKLFGVQNENILEMGDWIGGRYSVSSAANLSLMISIGIERYEEFLKGFHAMDIHFRNSPFERNIPVLLALIGIWNSNFFGRRVCSVIPYGEGLRFFPIFLQQLEMESNGKNVDINGNGIAYGTAPVIFGDRGTNSQHSFFQLLHQGSDFIPVDFIGFAESDLPDNDFHEMLISNMIAQGEALAFGIDIDTLKQEKQEERFVQHLVCEGNRPSNTIVMDELSPDLLGKLISIYEHKTFVQGIIWNINSFDQWGVQLGKRLSNTIFSEIRSKKPDEEKHDCSTNLLINHFLKLNSSK